tara:strand:- start:1202 stop:1648 length:447 start_codon:yes stop_codon:yes gene_type:complete
MHVSITLEGRRRTHASLPSLVLVDELILESPQNTGAIDMDDFHMQCSNENDSFLLSMWTSGAFFRIVQASFHAGDQIHFFIITLFPHPDHLQPFEHNETPHHNFVHFLFLGLNPHAVLYVVGTKWVADSGAFISQLGPDSSSGNMNRT